MTMGAPMGDTPDPGIPGDGMPIGDRPGAGIPPGIIAPGVTRGWAWGNCPKGVNG